VPARDAVAKGRALGVLLGVDGAVYGPDCERLLLVAATEKRTHADIERWALALAGAVGHIRGAA
jgi:hypothetical protein